MASNQEHVTVKERGNGLLTMGPASHTMYSTSQSWLASQKAGTSFKGRGEALVRRQTLRGGVTPSGCSAALNWRHEYGAVFPEEKTYGSRNRGVPLIITPTGPWGVLGFLFLQFQALWG